MKAARYYLAAALLVVLDQVIKVLTRAYLVGQGTVVLIPGVVGLTYVENTGMAIPRCWRYSALSSRCCWRLPSGKNGCPIPSASGC